MALGPGASTGNASHPELFLGVSRYATQNATILEILLKAAEPLHHTLKTGFGADASFAFAI